MGLISSDNCEHFIIIHADLNTFLSTLDKRYEKRVSKEGGTVARKIRILGAPFTSRRSSPVDGYMAARYVSTI